MIRINLLPVKVTKKAVALRQQAIITGLVLLLVVCVLAGFDYILLGQINEVKNKIAWTDSEINRLKQAKATHEQLIKAKKAVEEKLNTIDTLEKNRSGPVHMLDELALAIPMDKKATIPKKIWIKSLKQSGNSIELTGQAIDNEIIASFMDKLENSPYFSNVVLGGTEEELGKDVVLYKFTLRMSMEKSLEGTTVTPSTRG